MKKNFFNPFIRIYPLYLHKVQVNLAMAKRTIFLVKNSAPKLQCQMIHRRRRLRKQYARVENGKLYLTIESYNKNLKEEICHVFNYTINLKDTNLEIGNVEKMV